MQGPEGVEAHPEAGSEADPEDRAEVANQSSSSNKAHQDKIYQLISEIESDSDSIGKQCINNFCPLSNL